MSGELLAGRRGWLLAAICPVVVCLAAGCGVAAGAGQARPPGGAATASGAHAPPPPRPSPAPAGRLSAGPLAGGGPARLAGLLTAAEAALRGGHAAPAVLARQALTVQLACLRVAQHPGWASAVTAKVAPAQRAAATADIAGTADLVALTAPQPRLPRWRIVAPRKLAVLRDDYRAAQAATGVGWSYLAAINFVETDFGRIAGTSTAGAQGPMQFLPATWASYGHGSIHRAKNAIFAAARFLAAHGAARRIGPAVYAYNQSWRYVDAVRRYASRIRRDPQALAGYYQRQVIYRLRRGWVLLPPGYGTSAAARPIRLRV